MRNKPSLPSILAPIAQGHTSWSIGPGTPSGSFTDTDFPGGTFNTPVLRFLFSWLTTSTIVALITGATDVHEIGSLNTVLANVTVAIAGTEGCAFATPASTGVVSASCSASGRVVGTYSGVAVTSVVQEMYTSLAAFIPVQVPDSGSGAIPSGTTKNGASKGGITRGVAGAASLLVLLAGLMRWEGSTERRNGTAVFRAVRLGVLASIHGASLPGIHLSILLLPRLNPLVWEAYLWPLLCRHRLTLDVPGFQCVHGLRLIPGRACAVR